MAGAAISADRLVEASNWCTAMIRLVEPYIPLRRRCEVSVDVLAKLVRWMVEFRLEEDVRETRILDNRSAQSCISVLMHWENAFQDMARRHRNSDDASQTQTSDGADGDGELENGASTALERLQPEPRAAVLSYRYGEEMLAQLGKTKITDPMVHGWLQENGTDSNDIVVNQKFSTWARTLRRARSALGQQKHTPGKGHTTRSVINPESVAQNSSACHAKTRGRSICLWELASDVTVAPATDLTPLQDDIEARLTDAGFNDQDIKSLNDLRADQMAYGAKLLKLVNARESSEI